MNTMRWFFIGLLAISVSSCDLVEGLLDDGDDNSISESEVVKGLKLALEVGADTAVTKLSATDGYYGDELLKILLPPEADIIIENKDNAILQAIGIEQLIDDAVIRLNRAAEDAAETAKPIFVSAITNMSISDGMDILYGTDTAATQYLRQNTYASLKTAYAPKVQASLDKELVGNVSTQEAWDALINPYNDAAETLAGQLAGLEPVNTELEGYVTGKALDGLFYKVSLEEQQIREDPWQWVSDLLQDVFGLLHEN